MVGGVGGDGGGDGEGGGDGGGFGSGGVAAAVMEVVEVVETAMAAVAMVAVVETAMAAVAMVAVVTALWQRRGWRRRRRGWPCGALIGGEGGDGEAAVGRGPAVVAAWRR